MTAVKIGHRDMAMAQAVERFKTTAIERAQLHLADEEKRQRATKADREAEMRRLADHFEDIFTIEDAGFWPKPHAPTYDVFLQKHGINPKTACMFEDMAINLKPAHDLGMTTVWLHAGRDAEVALPHVHHRSDTLARWLENTVQKK